MEQVFLDVSELPAPEPFDKIMAALSALEKGQYLLIAHRKQPVLLYKPLQDLSYNFHVQTGENQPFEIFIWPEDDASPSGIKPPNLAILNSTPPTCSDN